VATFTPTSTLPRITAPVKAYDFSTQTISKTEITKSETANGDKITQAKDIINSKLVIKPTASTPSKAGMASTLSNITKSTGLETVSLTGGKVTALKPGAIIPIDNNSNTKYNSTAKLNTTASQKEILKNVEAVKKAGLNTVLIQAYSDSTGKSDYNLGLSQARANEDLKNYAVTMEKNGYSSKDGQWKDATGKVVPASKCTSFCSFTKTGETVPTIQLAAQGKGEVTSKTAGALGAKQAEIVAKGCSNSRAGQCAALHDAQRVSLIGGVLDKSLIKTSSTTETGPRIISDGCPPFCTPEPQCLNPLGCNTTTTSTTTSTTTTVTSQPASRLPGATSVLPAPEVSSVNPGSTTTSRLPSGGVVSGGSSVGSGAPSSGPSTTGSASTTSPSGIPSSGVSGTPSGAGSSSSGSTLLPPSVGLGGPITGGTLGSTPSTTTSGSTSTATPAPKFKVS
jgi:outer membrane protein OmpA-like peptidoglycan-associated protein